MLKIKGFQKGGSGVYQCRSCKRTTRNTGGDEGDLRMCLQCYELAGIENAMLDGCMTQADKAIARQYLAELRTFEGARTSQFAELEKACSIQAMNGSPA